MGAEAKAVGPGADGGVGGAGDRIAGEHAKKMKTMKMRLRFFGLLGAITLGAMCAQRPAGANAGAMPGALTYVGVNVQASTSGTIPAGVKSWGFVVLSGSGTFLGVPVAAGFADSDGTGVCGGLLGQGIAYSTGSNSSAYVRYGY